MGYFATHNYTLLFSYRMILLTTLFEISNCVHILILITVALFKSLVKAPHMEIFGVNLCTSAYKQLRIVYIPS